MIAGIVATVIASPVVTVVAGRERIEDKMPDHPCFHIGRIYTDAHGSTAASIYEASTSGVEIDRLNAGARVLVCGTGYGASRVRWVIYPGSKQDWTECDVRNSIVKIGEYTGPCKSGWTSQLKLDEFSHRD